jgi:hypothetical protein
MLSSSENSEICEFEAKLFPEDFSDEFRKIVHDYKCPLCKGVYYNPYVDKCGHVFCRECILKYLEKFHHCPFSKQEITTDNLNKLVFMIEILEKQLVKCKNRKNGCEWIGKLNELEPHMDHECKRQIISCPNIGCCSKIFREESEGHVAFCDYRVVCCEFCKIFIAFVDLKRHCEVCPKFIMDCLQQCGNQVERKEMEKHIEELCLNSIINCPFTGIGCEFVCAKKELARHFFRCNAEHILFMFSYMIKSQRSLNSVKENIVNALICFHEKSKSNSLSNNGVKIGFANEHQNLLNEIKQSLEKFEENKVKDHSEIFSFLKVGFMFNKNKENELDGPDENFNKDCSCSHLVFPHQISQQQTRVNCLQEKNYYCKEIQELMENDEKVSNSIVNKENFVKINPNPASILGNIPGNISSIIDLNETNLNFTEKIDKDCFSKNKLLGFKRRKITEEEKSNEDEKGGIKDNNSQINEVQISSLMDIQN